MKKILLLSLLLCWSLFGQAPRATITGTLANLDTSAFNGTIQISWPAYTSYGRRVPAGTMPVVIMGGTVSIALVPTASWLEGGVYTVVGVDVTGVPLIQFWSVPIASTVSLANVQGSFTATASIGNAAADGTTKGQAAFTANDFNASAGVVSLDYANAQAASASVNGFLSAASFASFTATRTRSCDIPVGDQSGSAITDAQLGPQSRICLIPAAATVVEVDVNADADVPQVIVGRNHAGSISNLTSAALATAANGGIACAKGTAVAGVGGTTCSATLQNTSLAAGDYIELVSGTAGGTAKFFVVHVLYTVN